MQLKKNFYVRLQKNFPFTIFYKFLSILGIEKNLLRDTFLSKPCPCETIFMEIEDNNYKSKKQKKVTAASILFPFPPLTYVRPKRKSCNFMAKSRNTKMQPLFIYSERKKPGVPMLKYIRKTEIFMNLA